MSSMIYFNDVWLPPQNQHWSAGDRVVVDATEIEVDATCTIDSQPLPKPIELLCTLQRPAHERGRRPLQT
jgi:hypothetical protein